MSNLQRRWLEGPQRLLFTVGSSGEVTVRVAIPLALTLLAGCGPAPITAGTNVNGGVIGVSASATYAYTLSPSPEACGEAIANPFFFRLRSDSGATHWINAAFTGYGTTGLVNLTAGTWRGEWFGLVKRFSEPAQRVPLQCAWTLTLTPK